MIAVFCNYYETKKKKWYWMRVSSSLFLSIFKMRIKMRKRNILFYFALCSFSFFLLFLCRSRKTNESDEIISCWFFFFILSTSIASLVSDFYFPHFFVVFFFHSFSAFPSVIRINIRNSLIFMSFWMFFGFSFAIHRILFECGKWDEG